MAVIKRAPAGLHPKCGRCELRQVLIDGVEQDATEPGSSYGAAAAEDGYATDHDRRNDQELVAEAGHELTVANSRATTASEAGYAPRSRR